MNNYPTGLQRQFSNTAEKIKIHKNDANLAISRKCTFISTQTKTQYSCQNTLSGLYCLVEKKTMTTTQDYSHLFLLRS